MPGCSHMSQEERPAETLGMIREWLARVEGRA
jgi:pimeloyl-ACP methyl ester carboxylesterase